MTNLDLGTRDGHSPLARLTKAKGMLPRLAQGLHGYKHAEAYCLMVYRCSSCGHLEVIWNTRDGVTPFGTSCPSCGLPTFCHSMLSLDWCVPEHRPHWGQRVWIDMTLDRATQLARRSLALSFADVPPPKLLAEVAASIHHNGHAPDLAICGYGWSPST